jgi:predicted alpha-1,6-mannanase (GH76 family)
MRTILKAGGVAVLITLSACSKKNDVTDPVMEAKVSSTNWAAVADTAQVALTTQFWSTGQHYYNQNNNGNTGFNYWWNAHALDVLVDGYNRTHDAKYLTQMKALMDGVKAKNGNTMRNTFFDDMEWMALASLRAYTATNDSFYKDNAKQLWEWIKLGWTTVNNGGIMWSTGTPNSKNACSNAPAAILAARLYQLDKNPDDLAWAKKIYDWQKTYVVDGTRGLVWDAYGNTNEGNIYTYNQGTYIGAGLELYRITKEAAYRDEALRNAEYIIYNQTKFSPKGVLKGENTGDGGLFKGIFIRYVIQFIENGDMDVTKRAFFLNYLKINGNSLLTKATKKPDYIFGADWATMPSSSVSDCSVQLSALMLLEGLDELQRLNLK